MSINGIIIAIIYATVMQRKRFENAKSILLFEATRNVYNGGDLTHEIVGMRNLISSVTFTRSY